MIRTKHRLRTIRAGRRMPFAVLFALGSCCAAPPAGAQVGPNSPGSGANNASVGINAWSTPANIRASDDTRATVSAKGVTNYVVGTGFGFSLPVPSSIIGIQLEVEKRTAGVSNVAVLDNWTTGTTKTVSAGTNRCLIVVVAIENGVAPSRDIIAMTYGGRSMTQVAESNIGGGTGFSARLEVWRLLEAQIALASGTAIVATYDHATLNEYCETFSSAVFQHVDQLLPVSSLRTSGLNNNTNPHQLGASITTLAGSMAVNAVMSGNNTTPAVSAGGTNTYTINSGYTEGTDIYFANPAQPTSGACLQTAHKAVTTAGTEQPTCTFNGSVNRHVMVGFTLQRARELDHAVRLVKAGTPIGDDRAAAPAWGTTDSYTTYGGPADLWGAEWTVGDINHAGFGAAVSAFVQNGTAGIDHVRMTVYSFSTLPVELIGLQAVQEGGRVRIDWMTATETNNEGFIVQRSLDGAVFEDIGRIAGAGNAVTVSRYRAWDERPARGTNYYRLKQVDFDGKHEHSPLVAVEFSPSTLVLFPNPTTDGRVAIHDADARESELAVYTSDMRLVRTAALVPGVQPVVHLGDLPDGTYVIMVRSGESVRASRVVKASGSN